MPDGPPSTTHCPWRTEKLTSLTTDSRTPPCRCMVKVLATLCEDDGGHGGSTEETSSWV